MDSRGTRLAGTIHKSRWRGLSLVEVLVALTVLSLAGAALVGLLVSSRVAVRLQGQRLAASALAQTRLEAAGRGNFLALSSPTAEQVTEDNVVYTVATEALDLVPPVSGTRRVRTTVQWTFRGISRQEFRERVITRSAQ